MRMQQWRWLCLAAVLISPSWVNAHVDFLIARDSTSPGAKLVTGEANLPGGPFTVGQRVFEGEFNSFNYTEDPGFNAVAQASLTGGFALPANTAVAFNIVPFTVSSTTSNLFYWDGVGAVNFVNALGESITFSRSGPSRSAVADATNTTVTGFNINSTDIDGALHKHLDIELSSGAPAGIYLTALEITMAGLQNSDPAFIVFATDGVDAAIHESAVDWVGGNIDMLTGVPEPSTYVLVGLPLLAFAVWRYRRRPVGTAMACC